MAGVDELVAPDAPLVSVGDFAEVHGIDQPVDAALVPRIQSAIQVATGIIRALADGRIFTPMDGDEVTIDGSGGRLVKLPGQLLPIRDVSAVVEEGVDLAVDDFTWSANGILERADGHRWTSKRRGLVVTVDHGWLVLPQGVVGVCLSLAKRYFDSPAGQQVQSETLGSYSVQFAGGGDIGLTEIESQVIRKAVAPR